MVNNIHEINALFADLIAKRGVYRTLARNGSSLELKRMYNQVRSIRHRIKNNQTVTIDFKLKWLVRSGMRLNGQRMYTQSQVVSLLDRAARMNKESRAMGGAYLLEKLTQ